MKELFVIEILGEPAFHKVLIQSGHSGRDYQFFYCPRTNSHVRAYKSIDEYRAERIDMHRASNIWPLLANIYPVEKIDRIAVVGGLSAPAAPAEDRDDAPAAQAKAEAPVKRGRGRPPKSATTTE